MKTSALLLVLFGAAGAAQAQVPPAETQAVAQQLNRLMRNPQNPNQEVTLTLNGCGGEQLIRDRGAKAHTSQPLGLSFNRGKSGWAVKMDNGIFEMKMSFEWADVTALTYEPATDDDGQKHFQVKANSRKKGSSISLEFPLYTTNEAVVKEVVGRLEKVRQGCQK
ncbi:hypothetical protein IC235_03365 [Hymenobacter sp. BT664]|uniref:Uncharacterized protein n=1 Tax=Hymenobacter montanus TaxID=2771359 RepID=A0A927GIA9_9BACT|nr:hypothetical protein [Hymenobacter montanus]MBD2766929.1 hypothetical protein [Hymenobacter montanus]